MFRNRAEAAALLGQRLREQIDARGREVAVLGIPRGGVVVAAPVATALDAPLDVIVPRKIGAPEQPELAVGALAIAEGEEILLRDEETIAHLRVTEAYLKSAAARERREIERRVQAYREGRPPVGVEGRTVVIVDDGIATGLTARAAAAAVARLNPREVILAAPVAPPETLRDFHKLGLRLVILETPTPFMAVGQFYEDFRSVEDDEVRAILRASLPS